MQRHQCHCLLAQLRIIDIRNQRHLAEEILQRSLVTVTSSLFGKILGYAQKLLQILQTALILSTAPQLQLLLIACALHYVNNQLLDALFRSLSHEVEEQASQLIQLAHEATGKSRHLASIGNHVK